MSRVGPFLISSDDTSAPAVATATEILSTGQGGLGQDASAKSGPVFFTAGVASFVSDVVDVAGWATDGVGTAGDPWTGWDTAITWSGSKLYWFRPGTFLLTATLALPNNYTLLMGSGVRTTTIQFTPTANDTAIEVSNGANAVWNSGISNLSIRSADSTYTKVAVDLADIRWFTLRDVEISGSVTVGSTDMWSGSNSIGLRSKGREHLTIQNVSIFADRPIVMSANPNANIDTDHFRYMDVQLVANANPVVQIDNDLYVTNLTFDGRQAWVKGTYGLFWVDTSGSLAGQTVRISNVRWEQAQDNGGIYGYFLYISHSANLYNFSVECCYGDPAANGIFLNTVKNAHFQTCFYPGTAIALSADNTCNALTFDNCFFQSGSTVTTTGLTKVFDSGQSTLGGTINSRVIYDVPSAATNAVTMVNATVSGRLVVPVVATGSLPAAGAANDGLVLIEETGGATCNLVFYKNGRRFKAAGTEA